MSRRGTATRRVGRPSLPDYSVSIHFISFDRPMAKGRDWIPTRNQNPYRRTVDPGHPHPGFGFSLHMANSAKFQATPSMSSGHPISLDFSLG